ncbi:DVU0524 family FlgM-associated protein [Halodesulfovibrio sp.]|jgi:hypothetical protein|uniref:DVU0524 family FlgM-associated protein n=1 Tax=Halodesulfovibrio sp. TaxID=1912772 RepID=UPI0025E4818A|nr:DVU0524 family FlgM-associated protein [Halodesulfovibrio sp.]MCT4534247.1 hypothetical protein [Halodesulfovibrio sp.]MCT4627992.1 hypothetical protein [Halodesulfovibrio sp.]
MTVKSFYVQNMLRKYKKQITSAQLIARAGGSARILQNQDYQDGDAQLSDINRKLLDKNRQRLVERVAREVYENLLFSGSNNPIVEEIKTQLEIDIGFSVLFRHPFPNLSLQIYKESEFGPIKLSGDEKEDVLNKLWAISLDKVNATML